MNTSKQLKQRKRIEFSRKEASMEMKGSGVAASGLFTSLVDAAEAPANSSPSDFAVAWRQASTPANNARKNDTSRQSHGAAAHHQRPQRESKHVCSATVAPESIVRTDASQGYQA